MSTGNIENWDGAIAEIGPIYPFVGSEGLMVIVAIILWIGWHIYQIKSENKRYEAQARALRQSGGLQKALADEHTIERM